MKKITLLVISVLYLILFTACSQVPASKDSLSKLEEIDKEIQAGTSELEAINTEKDSIISNLTNTKIVTIDNISYEYNSNYEFKDRENSSGLQTINIADTANVVSVIEVQEWSTINSLSYDEYNDLILKGYSITDYDTVKDLTIANSPAKQAEGIRDIDGTKCYCVLTTINIDGNVVVFVLTSGPKDKVTNFDEHKTIYENILTTVKKV